LVPLESLTAAKGFNPLAGYNNGAEGFNTNNNPPRQLSQDPRIQANSSNRIRGGPNELEQSLTSNSSLLYFGRRTPNVTHRPVMTTVQEDLNKPKVSLLSPDFPPPKH
jgi:hypothetical protein